MLVPAGLEEIFLETDRERLDAMVRAHGVQVVGPSLTTA